MYGLQSLAISEFDLCHAQVIVSVWPPGFAGLTQGSFITVPSRDGDYYRVTNNYIYNGRGCGIISKASNGVISGNSINKMLYPAIELSPNFEAKEGSFVSNTTVGSCLTTMPMMQCTCLLYSPILHMT